MSLGLKIVCLVFGVLFSLLWLYLMKSSNGLYDEQIESIDKEEYFLPDIFQIGYCAIEKLNIDMKMEFFKKKYDRLVEVKGEEAADFYLYTNLAGQISYVLTLLPIVFMFALIADTFEFVVFGIIGAGLLAYYLEYSIVELLDERHDVLVRDLPTVLSKMALLINTGIILKEAWSIIAHSNDKLLYQEMREAEIEMENGLSDKEALANFARRCNVKEVRKFISVVEQNLEKGSQELAQSLKELANESWNEKKQITIQKGAAADSKLLIPTGLIFMGILIIIIVPLFSNMF